MVKRRYTVPLSLRSWCRIQSHIHRVEGLLVDKKAQPQSLGSGSDCGGEDGSQILLPFVEEELLLI